MLSSLYSGISGLLANSDALDVISNNISNVNTVGYKSQGAQFEGRCSTRPSWAQTAPPR